MTTGFLSSSEMHGTYVYDLDIIMINIPLVISVGTIGGKAVAQSIVSTVINMQRSHFLTQYYNYRVIPFISVSLC